MSSPNQNDNVLPSFRYRVSPIDEFVKSDEQCLACGKCRGYIYNGPVYGGNDDEEDYNDKICPWCIASGAAHKRLGVSFGTASFFGPDESCNSLTEESLEELEYQTPGFVAWQEAQWWAHCGEIAQYVGTAGTKEVEEYGPDVIDSIRKETCLEDDEQGWQDIFQSLRKDGDATAYVFQCTKCNKYGGYYDAN